MSINSEKVEQTFTGRSEWGVAGSYFKLTSGAGVTVELYRGGVRVHLASNVDAGHYQNIDFDRVVITSGVSQLIGYLYAPAEGGSDRFTGAITILQGTGITNVAEATVGLAESSVNAASASRRSIRWRAPTTNTANIYLGATGITTANGCIEIKPGETWVESDGAGAQWFAISGTAGQKLRIQEIA